MRDVHYPALSLVQADEARQSCHPPGTHEETRHMLPQPDALPDDLPPPTDDGAARHLPGRRR